MASEQRQVEAQQVLEAEGAIAKYREVMGATNPANAAEGSDAPAQITVTASDSSCELSGTAGKTGANTFVVTNNGNKVTEFYVYGPGDKVMGEIENVSPGLQRKLIVQLSQPGTYQTACKPGMIGDGIRNPFSVAPSDDQPAVSADDQQLAEQAVAFRRELAVMVARTPSGEVRSWPVVHTVQEQGICTRVEAPASEVDRALADDVRRTAEQLAEQLGVTGVMAVEVFETGAPTEEDRGWVVNELAMRPHNSGHWTMDGAVTGQFEQHLRAVLDLPLGDVTARAPWTVMGNVLGGEPTDLYPTYRHLMARDPELKVHLYGKGVRPGRKIGHVNVSGSDLADLRERARHAADYIQGVIDE